MSAQWRKEVWWWEHSNPEDHHYEDEPRVYWLMEGGGDPDADNAIRAIIEKEDGLWQVAVWVYAWSGSRPAELSAHRTLKRAKAEAVKFWRKGTKMGSAFVKMGRGRLKTKPKWAQRQW